MLTCWLPRGASSSHEECGDEQGKRESESRNLQGTRMVELLIEHSQPKRKMGNKGSKEEDQQIKVQDKIPSEIPLGKRLRYWDDSPHTKGKKKYRTIKYCCFIWTQEPTLKPLGFFFFLPKFESDEDWVCQLLIKHVNYKSPVTQEEMEYDLY
jgi:hypothetical protein